MAAMTTEGAQPRVLFDMPRARKAEYWAFLKLIAPSPVLPDGQSMWRSKDASRFYCLRCKKEFPFVPGSSATVRSHLNNAHNFMNVCISEESSDETSAIGVKRPPELGFLSPSKRKKHPKSNEEAQATKLLVEWICVSMRPLTITDDQGLRDFVQYIQSFSGVYTMPSRRTLSDWVTAVAEDLRIRLKATISRNAQAFLLTTDLWTSCMTESYQSLPPTRCGRLRMRCLLSPPCRAWSAVQVEHCDRAQTRRTATSGRGRRSQ